GDRNGASLPYSRRGGTETNVVARTGRPDGQAIGIVGASLAARVAQAHEVVAVGRGIEEKTRVLAEPGTAVVIAVIQIDHRKAVGRKGRSGRMNGDLVHGGAEVDVRRRRVEIAAALAGETPELAVVVGILGQLANANELVADPQVIIHR